jgi:hypothetical protein
MRRFPSPWPIGLPEPCSTEERASGGARCGRGAARTRGIVAPTLSHRLLSTRGPKETHSCTFMRLACTLVCLGCTWLRFECTFMPFMGTFMNPLWGGNAGGRWC